MSLKLLNNGMIKIYENNENRLINARDLWQKLRIKTEFSHWITRKIKKYDFEKFSSYIANHIISILSKLKDLDNRKVKLFDLIYNKGIYIVNELSKKVSWSSRQINRYFNTQFGFPLKKFLNIVRCHHSYEKIANGDLYPSTNYTDQAHFIKEIKKYTDNTPKELHKNDNDRFIQLSPLKKK